MFYYYQGLSLKKINVTPTNFKVIILADYDLWYILYNLSYLQYTYKNIYFL